MRHSIYIAHHAVERYQKRWAPHLSFQEALRELKQLAAGARPERDLTRSGQERWVADASEKIVLVVKRDPLTRERICVTVLAEGWGESVDYFKEYMSDPEDAPVEKVETTPVKTVQKDCHCQMCMNPSALYYSVRYQQRWCEKCFKAMESRKDLPMGQVYRISNLRKKYGESWV